MRLRVSISAGAARQQQSAAKLMAVGSGGISRKATWRRRKTGIKQRAATITHIA